MRPVLALLLIAGCGGPPCPAPSGNYVASSVYRTGDCIVTGEQLVTIANGQISGSGCVGTIGEPDVSCGSPGAWHCEADGNAATWKGSVKFDAKGNGLAFVEMAGSYANGATCRGTFDVTLKKL